MFKRLEDIEVWKRGCRLAVEIYQFVERDPLAKNWGLRDQIQRAAISIPSNIAEGYERDSAAEFRRYLRISKGSCGELRTQLYIVKALGIVSDDDVKPLIKECIEISSMLKSLASRIQTKRQQ